MEEQANYSAIKDAGFSLFKRSKMLSILKVYIKTVERSKENNIIIDYYQNLNNLDKGIKSYLTKPLNEWRWDSFQGFYSELQRHIDDGDWYYVSNPSGGFDGFFWNNKQSKIDEKEFNHYLQLEYHPKSQLVRLIFKLCVNEKNERREIRDIYRSYLNIKAKELNIEISKFGSLGKHMGVAKLNYEYRLTNKNGLLDIQATVESLKEIMKLINETEKEIKAHNTVYN